MSILQPHQLQELQSFLYRNIPLSEAMAMRVESYDGHELRLSAPLAPNRNHEGTAFGGSLYDLAVLAGWSTLYLMLAEAGEEAHIVIRGGQIQYKEPVTGELVATCRAPDPEARQRLLKTFQRFGKARIQLDASIVQGQGEAVRFQGDYVIQR